MVFANEFDIVLSLLREPAERTRRGSMGVFLGTGNRECAYFILCQFGKGHYLYYKIFIIYDLGNGHFIFWEFGKVATVSLKLGSGHPII